MLLRDRILVLLVVVAALVAAGRTTVRYLERRRASLDHGSVPAFELRGSVLSESPEVGRASVLSLLGERLLVGARRSDSALYILSARTGRLVGSAGAKGEEAGQFRAPAAFVAGVDDPAGVWLYDVALRRLTLLRLSHREPAVTVVTVSASDVVQLQSVVAATDPVWLDDVTLLAPVLSGEDRFALFDRSGALRGYVGSIPPGPGDVANEAFRWVHLGKARADPGRARIAITSPYAGRLDIYRVRDWAARTADVPFPFPPEYAVVEGHRGPTFAPVRDTRFGYIDLAVTERYIFALFSGRTEISHPGRDNYAEYVHVLDWEGRFLRAYRLDEEVFAIAVDEEARTLYAARHLPEPAILVYDLDAVP